MKIITLLFLFIIYTAITFSQPFLKFGITNKGIETSIGALSKDGGIESTLSYKFSMTAVDKPKILSLSIGKQFLITDYEEDNYSITPTIGFGYLTWKDFSKYDSARYTTPIPNSGGIGAPLAFVDEAIMFMNEFKPVFGVEIAKDSYMGRVGIIANWCKDFYFGVNLRIFPYRNLRVI